MRIYFNQIDEHLRRDLGDTTISGTCDITGNTTVGGTLDVTGTTTLNGATTINNDIEIKGTDAGSTGPEIDFYHLSASPADSDRVGVINFFGNNDADEKVLFGKIETRSNDVSNGTERGQLKISLKTTDGGADLTSASDVMTLKGASTSASPEVQVEESLIINSFEAGGAFTGGPKLTLRRQELFTGVDNDEFSVIAFEAFNDRGFGSGGPENIEYAHIHAKILDASDGTEDGQLEFGAITAGSLVEPVLTINGTEVESNKPLKVSADFFEIASATAPTADNAAHPVISLYDSSDRSSIANSVTNGQEHAGAIRWYFNNDGGNKSFLGSIRGIVSDSEDGAERGSIEFTLPTGSAGDTVTDVTAAHSNVESPVMTLHKYGLVMASGNDIFIKNGELDIGDSTGSLSSVLHPRTTIGNTEQGGSSGDSRVALPDCQSVLSPATLSANFLFGNNIESDRTTMSTTEVCSMRGSGLFIYNDSDGLTLDLPAVSFSDSATTLRPGDELKFVSFVGTITFDTDASGTQQTIYKIGNTTNGTAAIAALTSGNFSLPAGGYMTLRAVFTNIYIIVEHCGVSGI